MSFQWPSSVLQSRRGSLLTTVLAAVGLTLFYALALRVWLELQPPIRAEWPRIVVEPVPPGYDVVALAWRARLDSLFCAGLALWMGWRYRNGRALQSVLVLMAFALVLPSLLLMVSETELSSAANQWTLFWLPLQLSTILLVGQAAGWLLAWVWGWARRQRP